MVTLPYREKVGEDVLTIENLPRVKAGLTIAEKPLGDSERDKLAVEAAQKLGYMALRDDASGSRSLGTLTGKLTETLLKLEIDVLSTEHVIRYQVEEAGRLTIEKIRENFSYWVNGYFIPAQWNHTKLSSYKQAIPEFVIRKAVQIKDAMPEVDFFVQFISEPKADPFLIAVYGEEMYYIEVWNEPRFESTL